MLMKVAENRAATGTVVLEGNKIAGQWMVFNDPSELMMAERNGKNIFFREVIKPEAIDDSMLTDLQCCADHREVEKYLGRTPNSLRVERNDTGYSYECDLLDSSTASEVRQQVERGDYAGNSFKMYVKDDTWELRANGEYLRTITKLYGVEHLGPVKNPAYINTSVANVQAAMRGLDASGLLIEEIKKEEDNTHELTLAREYRERDLRLKEKELQRRF
jgi:HK97 family phage prohead protease